MLKIILIILLFFKSILTFTKDFEENIRIIFGSCSNQNKTMKHWEYINSFNPNYLILLGDNVYGDFNTSQAKNLKNAYSKLNKNKYFYKLRRYYRHKGSRTRFFKRYFPIRFSKNCIG